MKANKPKNHLAAADLEEVRLDSRLTNSSLEGRMSWVNPALLKQSLIKSASYTAVMRFILVDREKRLFLPERYCFLGSAENWISIGHEPPTRLSNVVKKYIKHLGKGSIYELY
jgi:hypothetical protein